MGRPRRLPVMLCALLDIVVIAADHGKSDTGLALKLLTKSIPAEKLHCYDCKQNQHGCLNYTHMSHFPVVPCALDEPLCMVRRKETQGRVTEFSRSCSSVCVAGCFWKAASIVCTSCCNTSRCNVDSKAASIVTRDYYTATETLLLVMLVFHSAAAFLFSLAA